MSLRVWLPLTGHLNNQGIDDITVINNGATVDNSGKLGKCYTFSGSSTKLSGVLQDPTSSSIGSLSCWVKFTSFPASNAWYCLMQLGGLGGYAACRLGLYMEYSTVINISVDGSGVGTNSYTHSLSVNTWYHLCATNDGTTVKLYINGTEVLSKATTKSTYTTNATNLYAGGTNNYWFKGSMCDARYYDHALSPKEVKLLSQGLVCHYQLNDAWIESTTNLCTVQYLANQSGSWGGHTYSRTTVPCIGSPTPIDACNLIDITYSGSGGGGVGTKIQGNVPVSPSTTYTYSCYIKSSIGFTTRSIANILYRYELDSSGTRLTEAGVFNTSRMIALSNGWYRCWGSFTTQSTADKLDLYCYVYPDQNAQYYINCWQLEQKDHMTPYVLGTRAENVVYDSSGYNYHGTKTGDLTVSSDTSRYSLSTHFNGTSYSYLTSISPEIVSISLWVKWDSIPSGQSVVFMDYKSKIGFGLMSTGILCGSVSRPYYTFSKSSIVANTWYHFVIVSPSGATNTSRKLYINGVEQTPTSYTSFWSYSIDELQIGRRSYTSDGFVGRICDFRAYTTVLSADDVLELYHTSASIDKDGNFYAYELKEV